MPAVTPHPRPRNPMARTRINPRWKRAGASVTLAFLLWYTVKLVKLYDVEVTMPIAYVNVPGGLSFRQPLPTELRLSLRGEGHLLLLPSLMFGVDSLTLNLDEYMNLGQLPTRMLYERISERLPESVNVTSISPDTISLIFAANVRKRVPVRLRARVRPVPGFYLSEGLHIRPDSVTLTGSADTLALFHEWTTEPAVLEGINQDAQLPVQMQGHENIAVSPSQGRMQVRVARYTEAEITVQVTVANAPLSERVRLSPGSVRVRCLVPLHRYEQINLNDFRLEIDYNDLPPDGTLAFPRILSAPEGVKGIRLVPPYVRYVRTVQ